MKLNLTYKNILRSAFLIAGLALTGSASANLMNSDFSDGLNSWQGEYSYYDGTIETFYEPIANLADFASNLTTNPSNNSVTLSTSIDGINEYFGFYLFQEFTVAEFSSELSLSFESLADIATIELVDEFGVTLHNFMAHGLSFDISSLIGSQVSLEISIEDAYLSGYAIDENVLTVSNISISTTSVSEPSTFLLLSFALLAIRRKSMIRS